ncbi:MAG: carbohydrate-binding family 9-like protein [Armatimonadota bacterium]
MNEDRSVPEYDVIRVDQTPPLNKAAVDSFWRTIPKLALVETITGSAAPCITDVRVCWTSEALHLHFHCVDTEVFNEFRQRDDPIYGQEVVEMFIAESEENPTAYREFELSPFNVQWDGDISNICDSGEQMTADVSWDAASFRSFVDIIPAKTRTLPFCTCWNARISIDFQDLAQDGKPPLPGDIWRANFCRIEHKPQECYLAWSPTLCSPACYHVPSRFGRLRFQG